MTGGDPLKFGWQSGPFPLKAPAVASENKIRKVVWRMRGDLAWGVIEKDIGGLARRMEATSHNIANMNTPRYARREVSFEDQLKEVIDAPSRLPMKRTSERHFSNVRASVNEVVPADRSVGYEIYRLDLNNVDPETETARLAETRMSYQAMTRIMGRKIAMYRKAIGGGA
ncbi:MAG: flagellar basal body rod protein FlgB [Synergistaceae bacterium]|nr:flagellar basal body rod protein FlgB [Synergistaceae bacterium]